MTNEQLLAALLSKFPQIAGKTTTQATGVVLAPRSVKIGKGRPAITATTYAIESGEFNAWAWPKNIDCRVLDGFVMEVYYKG